MTFPRPAPLIEMNFSTPSIALEYAANTMSVIGGAASVIGFFMERSENRKINGKLSEIQNYLKGMNAKLDEIKQQNREIIDKIDALPEKIRDIVTEVVSEALLEERYSTLRSIELNYFGLGEAERARYRINSFGWDRISEALTYLVLHENRLSKVLDVIYWCEFALVASEGRGSKVIKSLIDQKDSMLLPLYEEVHQLLKTSHSSYSDMLASQYVRSHNFSANIASLDQVSYSLVDDRSESYMSFELLCELGRIPNGGGCVEREVRRSNPAAVKFNKKKKIFPDDETKSKSHLGESVENYAAVRDALAALLYYIESVKDTEDTYSSVGLSTEILDPENVSSEEVEFVRMAVDVEV